MWENSFTRSPYTFVTAVATRVRHSLPPAFVLWIVVKTNFLKFPLEKDLDVSEGSQEVELEVQ